MRILIAGLGAVGQRHARNLRALLGADLELMAFRRRGLRHVVTESLGRDDTKDVERELGITPFGDLADALATRPDAVLVCTPSSQHLEIARRAAEAGCDLFIEKPLSHTLEGVDRLMAAVERSGAVAMVGCQWRFHPCVRALRALLEGGTLGAIRSASIEYAEYLPDWHPYEDYRTSYAARSELGGGVVLAHIHDYDLAWWLFGAPRSVAATGGHLSDLELDVEDTADATLVTPTTTVRVQQSFASRVTRRSIGVDGEHGRVAVDLLAATFTVEPPLAPPIAITDYQRNGMFRDELAHFALLYRYAKPSAGSTRRRYRRAPPGGRGEGRDSHWAHGAADLRTRP